VLDDGVQDLGLQARHGPGKLRVVGDTGEDIVPGTVLRHGPAIIPGFPLNKQS
jgi:hypothetical protein